jgi:hypothetical protein
LGLFFIFQKGLNTEIDVAFAGRVFIDNWKIHGVVRIVLLIHTIN